MGTAGRTLGERLVPTRTDACGGEADYGRKTPQPRLRRRRVFFRLVTFKVRADTSCKAVAELLRQAEDPANRLEVVSGPRGGLRLGINGKFDPKLGIFVKK